nr:pentatricopeptide repeat protein AaPPR677 [Agave angustifolia]
MIRLWRIKPEIEHYGCLIDLLGRAGQLEKAVAIVIKMPVEPDIVIWRALLSACRTHGNIQLSERIIDHISKLDLGTQGGGHVLLSNLYASVGRWDEVARVRNRMGEECKGLSPGCSWIEVDGVVHEFLAADRMHPKIDAIRSKLVEVLREVSVKGGYIANTRNVLFDLSDEDREQAVYWHSEKLAVTFGLMSLEAGCSIRIVKNLRICEDCHSAMKAISHVFGREIVVRDRSRFHSFTEGECSCNDYW